MRARAICSGTARELDPVRVDGALRQAVQLRGRFVMEPARVALPDGANAPRHLAVALAHLELGWQADLAHQREDVLTVVHALGGGVVHVEHRIAQPRQLFANQLLAADRIEVPRDQKLRLQRHHALQ